MVKPLPIAVICAHGGLEIPPELRECIALSDAQIFNEADAHTGMLYDFGNRVLHFERFPYARAIIDVNRPRDDRAHARSGDGAIKLRTSYGAPVYLPGAEPDASLRETLMARYWQPWQETLAAIARDPRVKLVIDGHSMAALGPKTYGDPGALRPRVLVGNFGDRDGQAVPARGPLTASPELARFLMERLGARLATLDPLAPVGEAATLNWPFWGGHQLATYGRSHQPWVIIEINRALYVGAQDGDSPISPPDTDRIAAIRDHLWAALDALVAYIES